MVNITHKSSSLRKAIATAIVKTSSPQTIRLIEERKIPKGDIFEFSRAAGLLAIKKTSDLIPDCHPLPVEFASINFSIEELSIVITVEVHTIYKTGVEVEAMHGASLTALVIYDMLKPVDKAVEISTVKLQEKSGGKSQHVIPTGEKHFRCAVIVCSDSRSAGLNSDLSGKTIIEFLESYPVDCEKFEIIPDEFLQIQEKALAIAEAQYDLLIFTGGTGVSERDVTPDAIAPLLDRQLPGVMEAARNYGQQRTGYAMLSRGVAGFIKNTLVITLPGSRKGVEETLNAIFPHLLHVFSVRQGKPH